MTAVRNLIYFSYAVNEVLQKSLGAGAKGIQARGGRFTQKLTWRQICDLYSLRGTGPPLNLQPHFSGAPGQDFAACQLDEDGNRAIAQLRRGLVPGWAKDSQVNTRPI